MSALYIMRYTGSVGAGEGVLYIGRGAILGVDAGNVRYEGTYTEKEGVLGIKITMTATESFLLVTGQMLHAGQSIQLTADFRTDFADGSPQHLFVGGHPIAVTFERLGDIP